MPEEIAKSTVVAALRAGPLTFDQLREKTKIESGMLTHTLSRLFRVGVITSHSEGGDVVYQLVVKD
jgi:DNA-binding HxlR family transcriptional regulator